MDEINNQNISPEEKKRMGQGLYNFMRDFSVIGLAIGVVIAQTSTAFVHAMVKGIFTPMIELVVPGNRIDNLIFDVHGAKFDIGSIINAGLTFIIVMTILYIVFKKILKKEEYLKKK
jgi:large conductance mechanosensitive channel